LGVIVVVGVTSRDRHIAVGTGRDINTVLVLVVPVVVVIAGKQRDGYRGWFL
jgi:hypothetical protein